MKIIQLAHRTVDELLEEIFAITSKQKIDTNDRRVLYALACAMKNRYENDVPKWIPVSERLPEESEYCIITANDGVGHRTTFAKFQKKAKSWDLTGARSYWRVIAWMPLPKPFEGGTK